LHQYIGLALLFGALHIFLVKSDVSRYLPLKLWIIFFLSLAFYSYIYVKFLYYRIGPKYHYLIDDFNRIGDVLEVYLKPITKSLNFKPGQFVFLQFEEQNDCDMHPFSISSDPLNGSIRFSIKIVGDYTLGLRNLKKGTNVKLWGPYGNFSERFFQNKSAVCIAGGIGVTPFLGMLSLESKEQNINRDVFFFYCGKNIDELCYHNEIACLSQACPSIKYISHFSCDKGRINVKQILEVVGNFKDKLVFLCGPILMMKDLEKQFLKFGVSKNDIIFEDFNFR
ncbi:MAG: FAD-binding oxidoreductase, partial [Actinobacteria bacterium]|nr:FAD-binding oxidoreductase [Actinomycetota bacterium]